MPHGKVVNHIWEHRPDADTEQAEQSKHQFRTSQATKQLFEYSSLTRVRQRQCEWFMCIAFSSDTDYIWQGPRNGLRTLCRRWELTHQGSKNTVATLNPIRMHIIMKTGRLLGTQATIITAGMKSWEGHKQVSQVKRRLKVWKNNLSIRHHVRGYFGCLTESPMKTVALFPILRRTFCHKGTATEAANCGENYSFSWNLKCVLGAVKMLHF